MERKKNILMLLNDHQAHYRRGWDGGVVPQRPNFERVSKEGIEFSRAYAVAPLCVPVRTTMLTGLYPHNHKNVCNDTRAPFNHELIFTPMERAGYKNYYFGKWHAGPGTATDFGPEGFSREDYGNPYISKEYKQYLKKYGYEMPKRTIEHVFTTPDFMIQHPDLVEGNTEYMSDKLFSGENAVGISNGPKETHESFFLANMACDAIRAEAGNDEPFFMRVDFWGPHHPHFPSKEFADLYNPEDIELYPSFDDDLTGRPPFYKEDSYGPMVDKDGKLIYPNPIPKEKWQLICARAFAHITQVDAAGGMILDLLDELGLADDTIVIWSTDHGDALASHGGLWDKGSFMTEEVMRVPLAIRNPGVIKAGLKSDALINSVDIPATILDMADAAFDEKIDGRSLVPLCENSEIKFRDDILCETYGIGFGKFHIGKAVITERYKYIWNESTLDELYDLKEDKYEMNNLIGSEKHSGLKKDMRERLFVWLNNTGGETDLVKSDLENKSKSGV